MKAYCFKCRRKTDIKDAVEVTLRNGQPMIRGVCSVCGLKVIKIIEVKEETCQNAKAKTQSTF